MSTQITTGFTQQFSSTVNMLVQQEQSRLRMAVDTGSYTGKQAQVVHQLGLVTAQKRTTRHADTPLINTPHDARWVFPEDYEIADLLDPQDELRSIASFESPYARNMVSAINRAIDDEVIAAFFSTTTKTGESAGTTTSWATFVAANPLHQVAASASGLTVAKLRAAKKALMEAEVDIDREQLFCAITAEQHDDLLGDTQVVSLDYNSRPVLVDGRITSFMGFNFIHTERLGVDGSSNRRVPVWAKSGMHLGIWGDVTTRISERDDKSYSTQVYAKATIGATRVEEKKIVEVLCAE